MVAANFTTTGARKATPSVPRVPATYSWPHAPNAPDRIDHRVQLVLDETGTDVDVERPGETEISGQRQDKAGERVTQRMPAAEAVASLAAEALP